MRVLFNEEACKGCSLCVSVCPKKIIALSKHMNEKGYQPAAVADQEQCISCAACALICPDAVITVYRPEKKKREVS